MKEVTICIMYRIVKNWLFILSSFAKVSNLWSANFSQKNERKNLFCLLFYSSGQTNQIHPFVVWKNLWLANLLFGFIWPLSTSAFLVIAFTFPSYCSIFNTKLNANGKKSEVDTDEHAKDIRLWKNLFPVGVWNLSFCHEMPCTSEFISNHSGKPKQP